MVMIMKQFILFILAGCIVLFSGCQSDVPPTESLETEPTFLDASWQKATDSPQSEETIAETKSANVERSDETIPTQTVCPETIEPVTEATAPVTKATEPATEGMANKDKEEPAPAVTEQTEVTVPPTQERVPATEETDSVETVPAQTVPSTTEPVVTEPPTTEPLVTEPTETEPEAESIDTAALEAYGRSYASSTYGYNGTSACTPGTGAGYFPAATKEILSMEDGYSYVCQAVDSQYKRDMAYGYSPYEEIDGQTVRCPINISVTSAGGNTYTITVYYGGTA